MSNELVFPKLGEICLMLQYRPQGLKVSISQVIDL